MNFYDHIFFGDNAQLVKWLKTRGTKETRTMKDYTFDAYADHLLNLVNAKPASKKCFKHQLFLSGLGKIMKQGYVLKTESEEFVVTDSLGLQNRDHIYEEISVTSTGMIVDRYRNDICSIDEIKYITPIITMTQDDLMEFGLGDVNIDDDVINYMNDISMRLFNALIDGASNLFKGELKTYVDRHVAKKNAFDPIGCSRLSKTTNNDFDEHVLDMVRMTDYILAEIIDMSTRLANGETAEGEVADLRIMKEAIKGDELMYAFQRDLAKLIKGAEFTRF